MTGAFASTPRAASPIATGGAGVAFEHRVGGCYLACVLAGASPRGQEGGVAREVRFQRLYEGEPLDDLIIESVLPTGRAKLALQVKRDLVFGEQDARFEGVLRACWDTYRSPKFTAGVDRFGVAVGLYSKVVDEHYRRVLDWARRSASATDFVGRIGHAGLSSAAQRSFYQLIRGKLQSFSNGAATDNELWGFLRHMVLLHFDFEADGSRDRALAVEQLRHVLPAERVGEAAGLFDRLASLAADTGAAAGSLDRATLQEMLSAEGVVLLVAPDLRADIHRMGEEARYVLRGIRSDIAGLEFDRVELVSSTEDLLAGGGLIEILGPPGTGKSNVLRALAERQGTEAPLLILSGERLNSLTGLGWHAVANELQLEHPLDDLLGSLLGGGRPCVYIDGVDRIVAPAGRAAVNDLLGAVARRAGKGGLPWTVVVTAREGNLGELHGWLAWHSFGQPRSIEVPLLSLNEVLLVTGRVPRLAPLLDRPQLLPVLTNAFFLRVLTDPRLLPADEAEATVATEVEVRDLWWDRLVGGGGLGRDRQSVLLELGGRATRVPGLALTPDATARGEVLLGLESDRILVREPGRDVYWFGHDVYDDWVLSRVLDQHLDDLPGTLRSLGQPFGLLRPVQLVVLSMLERTGEVATWLRLLDQFPRESAELRPRWRQAVLLAPLLSARSGELLDAATEALFAEAGAPLAELLRALRTMGVQPNLAYLSGAAKVASTPGELLVLLLEEPIPIRSLWSPLMAWLAPRLAEVPEGAREAATEVMLVWQRGTRPGAPYRLEVGAQALAWLAPFDEWRFSRWEFDDEDHVEEDS